MQKTAYEMRISDWSSDVCSSDLMLLTYMQDEGKRFTTLERVTIGGSACPESIIRAFRDDYGVDVIQGWGMTETSPLGTVSVPNASVAAKPDAEQMAYKLKQGRLLCGLEIGRASCRERVCQYV